MCQYWIKHLHFYFWSSVVLRVQFFPFREQASFLHIFYFLLVHKWIDFHYYWWPKIQMSYWYFSGVSSIHFYNYGTPQNKLSIHHYFKWRLLDILFSRNHTSLLVPSLQQFLSLHVCLSFWKFQPFDFCIFPAFSQPMTNIKSSVTFSVGKSSMWCFPLLIIISFVLFRSWISVFSLNFKRHIGISGVFPCYFLEFINQNLLL